MDDLLQLLHTYRTTHARLGEVRDQSSDLQSGVQSSDDQAAWLALGALLGMNPPWHGMDPPTTRRARTHPVTLALPSGFVRGEIRALTGAGALVSSRARPVLGTRCLVRIDDSQGDLPEPRVSSTRCSYLFPAVVSITDDEDSGAIALVFDGPSEAYRVSESTSWVGFDSARSRTRPNAQ